jgi:hypothetical protein
LKEAEIAAVNRCATHNRQTAVAELLWLDGFKGAIGVFFRPYGAGSDSKESHGLRRGLYSCAASRLGFGFVGLEI